MKQGNTRETPLLNGKSELESSFEEENRGVNNIRAFSCEVPRRLFGFRDVLLASREWARAEIEGHAGRQASRCGRESVMLTQQKERTGHIPQSCSVDGIADKILYSKYFPLELFGIIPHFPLLVSIPSTEHDWER